MNISRSVKQIVIIFTVSALIIGGLAWWQQAMNPVTDTVTPLETIDDEDFTIDGPLPEEELERINTEATSTMNPTALFQTNKGVIALELFEDKMPITVGNFVKLAEEGFYNNTKFHRVIDGFMIQGGDPNSKGDNPAEYGRGGPGYTIQDEFVADPVLTNTRGTIAMANTGQPNSGGSQFFINTVDNTNLDFDKQPLSSKHPVFGRVVNGMTVVDMISGVATGQGNVPVEPVVIESVTIQR